VIHYVLGFVAEEQNHAELVRAKILEEEPSRALESTEAFMFGIDAILGGLEPAGQQPLGSAPLLTEPAES
jgi:hypothetical protein